MKFLAENILFEKRGREVILDLGEIVLSVEELRKKSKKGRTMYAVQSADDNGQIGGYIGISKGPDGYHIGSPSENQVLRRVAAAQNWKTI
jgi:hypothetical protein